jgi:ferredoxin
MNRNIVFIDEDKCNGCGLCIPNCAEGAIKIIERDAPEFDEHEVKKHLDFRSEKKTRKSAEEAAKRQSSELRQWPMQLTLVSPQASYFKDSDLLVAADCVPFAYPNFHSDFHAGKSLIIGCPKFDDAESYVDKLTEILQNNKIKTITLVNMEVLCCFGLQHIVEEAVQRAGKVLPIRQTVITIRGEKQ